ncbi:MAG: hypothetical protein HZY76_11415 [Anaerolineae bacterium]|nr:MAG: hypothetical protein HZY76_11415 [Anaerolineae bacterium]
MQRLNHVPFLMQLTVVGLIVLLALGLPALAAHPESPAAPVPTEDERTSAPAAAVASTRPAAPGRDHRGRRPAAQFPGHQRHGRPEHRAQLERRCGGGPRPRLDRRHPGPPARYQQHRVQLQLRLPLRQRGGHVCRRRGRRRRPLRVRFGGVDAAHGPYAPIGPNSLADFIGSNPNGAWNLTLTDMADDEGGRCRPTASA